MVKCKTTIEIHNRIRRLIAKTLSILINVNRKYIATIEWQFLPKALMTVYLGLLASTLTSIVDSLLYTPCSTK